MLEILEQEGLLALTVERSLLSGMPLDRVGVEIDLGLVGGDALREGVACDGVGLEVDDLVAVVAA